MSTREELLEAALRRELWLHHGHRDALYGDDGEMQCPHPECRRVWDYKRADIFVLIDHVQSLRLYRIAKQCMLEAGLPYTDPRTGVTTKP